MDSGRIGRISATMGRIRQHSHLVRLKVIHPPKNEYIFSLPVLYRSQMVTIMADQRGPDSVQVGKNILWRIFRMPQHTLVRLGLTAKASSFR